ncbi:MAG: hypothetical protein H0W90_11575 [Actinobacteria bacterium]|nr:hypothetical protein [Actinomycetota bacterium]
MAVSALAFTAEAQAKELAAFRACGAAGCTSIRDVSLLRKLIRSVEAQGNPVSVATPVPQPFLGHAIDRKADEAGLPKPRPRRPGRSGVRRAPHHVGGIGTATLIVPATLLYRRRDPR